MPTLVMVDPTLGNRLAAPEFEEITVAAEAAEEHLYRVTSRRENVMSSREPHSRIECMRQTLALLLIATCLPVWAAQPVRARHGMVVSRERHATETGLQVLKNWRQCGRRRGRRGLRAGGDASERGQYRRRRLHADPPGRRAHHIHRLPRARSAAASRNMYLDASARRRRTASRLSRVGRAGHGARPGVRRTRSTARSRGRSSCIPRWNWRRRASRCRMRWRNRCERARGLSALPGIQAHLSEGRQVLRGRRDCSCSPNWRARWSGSRSIGAKDFYEGETARLLAKDMAATAA